MSFKDQLTGLKAIIFDMDGVLVDTEHLHMKAFEIYLKENDLEASDVFLKSLIGHSIEDNFKMLYKKYPQLSNKPVNEMIEYRNDIYLELVNAEIVWPVAGITEILDYCITEKITLALASSSDQIQVNTILDNLDKNISCNFSFNTLFKAIVAGDTVKSKKPAPDIYQSALQKIALPVSQVIAIEDSQAGVTSAKAAGLTCLALENPYNDVYKMEGPDFIIKSIYDLLNLLKENN